MLQTASDWWWGAEQNTESKVTENKDNDAKEEKKADKIENIIEFDKDLKSLSCLDKITALFKLIDFDNAIKTMLTKQFNNELTFKESEGLIELFTKIYEKGIPNNAHLSAYFELKIGEIILSYFASLSPTNPAAFGCWERWVQYRAPSEISKQIKSVKRENLVKLYDTCASEIGFENGGRLVWFISSEKYDYYMDDDTQRKGLILLLMSFFWDLNKNKFDLGALRTGISTHLNLSHWTVNTVGYSTVYAIKDAMVAFPYALKDVYILNPPMLVYLVKTVAAQFVTAHSLDKFVMLEDQNDFFLKYASKDKTPIICEGTSKTTVSQWMKERGYI